MIVPVEYAREVDMGRAKELSQASLQCSNLVGGFIDDFSSYISKGKGTVQDVQALAANVKSANPSLKLYAVCYTMDFALDLSAFLPYFDAIMLWVWKSADLKNLDAHVAEATRLYRKPLHLGVYLFDWAGMDSSRTDAEYWSYALKTFTMPMKTLQFQCERARQYLKDGRIEAIHILGSLTRDELKTDQGRWLADFCRSI